MKIINRIKLLLGYRFTVFVLFLIFTMFNTASTVKAMPYVFLTKSIQTAKKLDLSSGVISNDTIGYKLNIPEGARNFMYAEKEIIKDKTTLVEKINFYCESLSKSNKTSRIFSFYVFERSQWDDSFGFDKITITKNYVMAVEFYDKNNFTTEEDIALFKAIKKVFGTAEDIKKLLSIQRSQIIEYKNNIFVDREPIGKTIEIIDGVYYLPLSAVCEKLGYTVLWDESGIITIFNSVYKDKIKLSNGVNLKNGGKILIHNNRAYVSTSYFMQGLGKSIEIDDNNNIFIIK